MTHVRFVAMTAAILQLGGSMPARAHGPQIQLTADAGLITTRSIVDGSAYSSALSDPKTVYVMPLAEFLGVWRAQPDGAKKPDGTPEFVGWPGFAYGYGYDAVMNPAPFPTGSKFTLAFTSGVQRWNGAAFVDVGVTEAEIYRGPSAVPTALARSTDSAPFAGVQFPGGAGISFASEGADVHNTVNYRMLGDGASLTSPLPDGVYKLGLQLTSNATTITVSDPFHFVLTKGTPYAEAMAAVASLGVDPDRVQTLIPEPATGLLAGVGLMAIASASRKRRRGWQRG